MHFGNGSELHSANQRPLPLTLLSLFFAFGCIISFLAIVTLLLPGSLLEFIWQVNPRGHTAFVDMGNWSLVLLFAVSVACGAACIGIWIRKPYGYAIAAFMLAGNLVGDVVNVVLGIEPRAAIGLPIAGALLIYLSTKQVRGWFFPPRRNSNLSSN